MPVLIEHGADVNAPANYARTPLHYAVFSENAKLVRFLIEMGANVNVVSNKYETPLDMAESIKVKKLLRSHGGKTWEELNAEREK